MKTKACPSTTNLLSQSARERARAAEVVIAVTERQPDGSTSTRYLAHYDQDDQGIAGTSLGSRKTAIRFNVRRDAKLIRDLRMHWSSIDDLSLSEASVIGVNVEFVDKPFPKRMVAALTSAEEVEFVRLMSVLTQS